MPTATEFCELCFFSYKMKIMLSGNHGKVPSFLKSVTPHGKKKEQETKWQRIGILDDKLISGKKRHQNSSLD